MPTTETKPSTDVLFIRVGTIDELRDRQNIVVRGADRPICVFFNEGEPKAVDNRCPHLGFPLSKGTCDDGMITCHWHHARFDACSGCTFDLWADDVEPFDIEVRGADVYVSNRPRRRGRSAAEHASERLRDGLEQNIGLIIAKAILASRAAGVSDADIVRDVALFGARSRDGWAMGMTILTAMANVTPALSDETAYLALYQGARRVAADCAGQPPRRDRHPLETDEHSDQTLGRWLRYWTTVRHRTGAERTLMTAIQRGASDVELTGLVFTAATERFFADAGHLVDFSNKAFELLDLIGQDHASTVLPTLAGQLTSGRGGEESNAWRHPVDLIPMVKDLTDRLPELLRRGTGKTWQDEPAIAEVILDDDPHRIIESLAQVIEAGAQPEQLGKALAYAAAMRIARFGTANEVSDWIGALHTFSYCNALHQAIKRDPGVTVVRGVIHGAMSVYLDRFLNVPPARLPGETPADRKAIEQEQADPDELLRSFLDALDSQQQVDRSARLVARYLSLGHSPDALIDTLTFAAVREDANFHTLQMLEAGVAQFRQWPAGSEQARNILIAVARYLAAHSPTQRAQLQTARIALRLHRGEDVYEED